MKIRKEDTVLLIIDMQERLLPAVKDSEALINNCRILIEGCNILGVPIIATEQYSKGLGKTIEPISQLLVGVNPIDKREFSCFKNSEFASKFETLGRRYVIIAGVEAHVCVQQTAFDLMDEDYKPIIIANCISSRKEIDKKFALKRLRDYSADVTTYESILFELLVTSTANEFKAISKLVQ